MFLSRFLLLQRRLSRHHQRMQLKRRRPALAHRGEVTQLRWHPSCSSNPRCWHPRPTSSRRCSRSKDRTGVCCPPWRHNCLPWRRHWRHWKRAWLLSVPPLLLRSLAAANTDRQWRQLYSLVVDSGFIFLPDGHFGWVPVLVEEGCVKVFKSCPCCALSRYWWL